MGFDSFLYGYSTDVAFQGVKCLETSLHDLKPVPVHIDNASCCPCTRKREQKSLPVDLMDQVDVVSSGIEYMPDYLIFRQGVFITADAGAGRVTFCVGAGSGQCAGIAARHLGFGAAIWWDTIGRLVELSVSLVSRLWAPVKQPECHLSTCKEWQQCPAENCLEALVSKKDVHTKPSLPGDWQFFLDTMCECSHPFHHCLLTQAQCVGSGWAIRLVHRTCLRKLCNMPQTSFITQVLSTS